MTPSHSGAGALSSVDDKTDFMDRQVRNVSDINPRESRGFNIDPVGYEVHMDHGEKTFEVQRDLFDSSLDAPSELRKTE